MVHLQRSVLVSGIVLILLVLVVAGCGGQKQVIKLHAWEVDSHFLNNAIFEFIVEKGYGYPVETVVQTTPEMKENLSEGRIDLNLEGWQQNIPEWYDENIARGTIVNLGTIHEGASQFFVIPKWVAEEYNIRTVFDMVDHWELFQDPEDPSKGLFYSCLIGWQCVEINEVKLEAYGLTRYYNQVSPASGDALEAALARSQINHSPVFGYNWAPTALAGLYEWHILEEPAYSDACWKKVTDASEDESLRPIEEACAYETAAIDKLAHKGLLRKAPEVVEMLRKMVVGLEPINKTMAWAVENDVQEWERAAVYYLQQFEDRWKTWVTQKAYEEIKEALEDVQE